MGHSAARNPLLEESVLNDNERLRRLQAITEAALSHLALDDLLDELLTRVRDVFTADTCVVLLLDRQSDELVARAAKGLEEEVEQGVRIPVGSGFAGRVAAERRAIVIDDAAKVELVNPLLREKGVQSLLGAPLVTHDEMIGVLHVGSLTRRIFTHEEADLLELAADRIASSIERALVHDELVRLERLEHAFISIASHELRAPASAIYGAARILHHKDISPEQDDQLKTLIYEQSERLVTLIAQLLDLSRLEAGTMKVAPSTIVLAPALEQIMRALDCGEVDLKVPEGLEVITDRQALAHIVGNLVSNAFRYGAPPVTVSAVQNDRHFRIRVEDAGPGVAQDFVPQLFERFSRSSEAGSAPEGVGLGLAIARSYAQALSGDIVYRDVEPHGASFEVILPLMVQPA